jgi:hypothetical protein
LVAVGTIPFTQRLAAYGKAGVFRWDVDSRATVGAAFAGTDDKGNDFTYGAGIKYDFTRNLVALNSSAITTSARPTRPGRPTSISGRSASCSSSERVAPSNFKKSRVDPGFFVESTAAAR